MLVKQGCDECSLTWGISKEVHETIVEKKEAHNDRPVVAYKGSTRQWN